MSPAHSQGARLKRIPEHDLAAEKQTGQSEDWPVCLIVHRYSGAPGAIRTPDPLVRSQVLYPAELRALCVFEGSHCTKLFHLAQALFPAFFMLVRRKRRCSKLLRAAGVWLAGVCHASMLTYSMLKTSTPRQPAGLWKRTRSPARALSSARAIGDTQLIRPRVKSVSSTPTI